MSHLWYCNYNGKGTGSVKSWMFAQKSAPKDNMTPMSFGCSTMSHLWYCKCNGKGTERLKTLRCNKPRPLRPNVTKLDTWPRECLQMRLTKFRTNPINFASLDISVFIAPPIGRFWPNLAQRPGLTSETIVSSLMLITFILTKLCKSTCFLASQKICLFITTEFLGVAKFFW